MKTQVLRCLVSGAKAPQAASSRGPWPWQVRQGAQRWRAKAEGKMMKTCKLGACMQTCIGVKTHMHDDACMVAGSFAAAVWRFSRFGKRKVWKQHAMSLLKACAGMHACMQACRHSGWQLDNRCLAFQPGEATAAGCGWHKEQCMHAYTQRRVHTNVCMSATWGHAC